MKKFILGGALAMMLPMAAHAAPVDLSGWTAEEGNGTTAANWTVQGVGNDTVFQSVNSRPSVFFNPGSNDQGKSLAGEITVETFTDDDYIGFVLGYNTGELGSANADFWLIDWKKADQRASAGVGLSLSHVTGDVGNANELNFWGHDGVVDEKQRAANLGLTGWASNTTYAFELIFTSTLIEVKVNGNTELSYTSAQNGGLFDDGSFGFYNYSQERVRYAGITEDVAPPTTPAIPLPASMPLLLAGFGLMGVMRRRKG